MAHAPRSGMCVFCWDWGAHVGCARGQTCDRKHDALSEKNLHCAISEELIRRGGRKNRSARIDPENVDGVAGQLRDSNQKVHGEQSLTTTKAWWQKTAGSANRPLDTRKSAWKHTKRQLDWKSVVGPDQPPVDEESEKTGGGGGGGGPDVEVS